VAPKALIFQKFGVLRFVDFSTREETGLLLVSVFVLADNPSGVRGSGPQDAGGT